MKKLMTSTIIVLPLLILAIMLAVAFFNMSAALLTVVLERIRMIGLLRALGMPLASLRRIFRGTH